MASLFTSVCALSKQVFINEINRRGRASVSIEITGIMGALNISDSFVSKQLLQLTNKPCLRWFEYLLNQFLCDVFKEKENTEWHRCKNFAFTDLYFVYNNFVTLREENRCTRAGNCSRGTLCTNCLQTEYYSSRMVELHQLRIDFQTFRSHDQRLWNLAHPISARTNSSLAARSHRPLGEQNCTGSAIRF